MADTAKSEKEPATQQSNGGVVKRLVGANVQPLSLDGNLALNWKKWYQSFRIYLKATGLTDESNERKVAVFLYSVGDKVIEIFNTFDLDEDTVKYEDLIQKFEQYFVPKTNVTYESHKFFTRKQGQTESVEDFVTELKNLSKSCEFGDITDRIVKDIFICNMHENYQNVRERLLIEDNLTLEKAISISSTLIRSRVQATELKGTSNVFYVDNRRKESHQKSRSLSRSSSRDICGKCGQVHKFSCPASKAKCRKCHKIGHYEKYCKTRKVRFIHKSDSDSDSLFIGSLTTENESVNSEWTIKLKINDKSVKCILDTGSDANVMTLQTFESLCLPKNFSHCKSKVTSYSGDSLKILGQQSLHCSYFVGNEQKSKDINFIIADVMSPTVIGKSTCTELGLVKRVYSISQSQSESSNSQVKSSVSNENNSHKSQSQSNNANVSHKSLDYVSQQNMCQSKNVKNVKDLVNVYDSVFVGLGCLPGECHITTNPDVTPKIDAPRKVPFALHNRLQQELDNMVEMDVIAKVTEPTPWGSPHGSVMSCQSLAARAFTQPEDACTGFHRSVRFSSESRSSGRGSDVDCKRETPGSISLTALTLTPVTSQTTAMSQSAPSAGNGFEDGDSPPPAAACRFPKLEECAHFHYERVCLGGLSVELAPPDEGVADSPPGEGWISLKVRSHVSRLDNKSSARALHCSWSEASDVRSWTLARSADNCRQLDDMLHRCIYDRKVSGLPNLTEKINSSQDEVEYRSLIADYMHHLSIIADDSINCGPVLNWLQMDNKGHKLLVANEDSSSINTPAVAAAYSVRKYVSQARDEISFEVGDMISIIDMPGPQESTWWRGKRGFRVGFFPHHCVAVIGDKVPRHMTQPPPIVGSLAVAPIKPVLRKHGKLISLFRSFILSRPSRRRLKQQGILRERVFGCDLGEHLLNYEHDVPLVLVECARAIEERGAVDGIYRLSGGSGLTQRLRAAFDEGAAPEPPRDPHAIASLLKMYFRELPNPLCTYQLYESFVAAVQAEESKRLKAVRDVVVKLPPPHYRTLAYLMRHLRRVSLLGAATGMTARNMAIVWAPNLLRSPRPQHALQHVAVQAVVTEFLICYAEELFAEEQDLDSGPESINSEQIEQVELRGTDSCRRPKSLPLNPPTKLLSLEEARRRGKCAGAGAAPSPGPPAPSGAIAAAAELRPGAHRPQYIEVGSGPDNLPQYHTVLDLPLPGAKRGLKRSPSGWRGLFSRSKQQRHKAVRAAPAITPLPVPAEDIAMNPAGLRPVKSCESLASDGDAVAPLAHRPLGPLRQHTRSSSCDSYFEPWQAELAGMRLRLAPQERDRHMFSEEDDTHARAQDDSLCSTPAESGPGSVDPSPRRNLRIDIEAANELAERKRSALEEQLASIGYIDGDSPRGKPPEKRHSARPDNLAKRLCKDRDSPTADFQNTIGNVKLRERVSPKKTKPSSRYSGLHQPVLTEDVTVSRLSWQGKDHASGKDHSTLIKIDWPVENSVSNLTASTINSSPLTPITPIYDPLESDSEVSETNKRTIKINNCDNCDLEKCLKCELKAADYENIKVEDYSDTLRDSLEASPANSTNISYHNLNRLSAVSTSSNSEGTDKKKEANYENCDMKVMTSSHGSSSSYSNVSKPDELYECYSFTRPNYINLQSSSSKSSPGSPLKSPLKSTISITFRSPTKKSPDYEPIENDTPTNDRDSVYEDVDLEKNLSIVEDASIPEKDASLPTQQACQPDNFNDDLIILETPTDSDVDNTDVYSQVKFFKKSIEEVNAMLLESPQKETHYENFLFERDYENVDIIQKDNGNIIKPKESLNVRELAHRFESPTEQKGPFFEKFKTEVKYPDKEELPPSSPKCYKLSKNSANARSLDENAFVKEFGHEKTYVDRRKSLEVKDAKKQTKFLPDLNLNMEENDKVVTTPTTENKISLIQRFDTKKPDLKNIIGFDTEKKLSRERIEKYKEERRNFLREKYSSQSFRSNPEQLTRLKLKKEELEESPKFERRNTVDLGQRMRFSLARSSHDLDTIPSPTSPGKDLTQIGENSAGRNFERKEKVSPSYNIRDMAAMFEQKSQNTT